MCGLFLISEFDVRFNPDIYAPGTKHAPSEVTLANLMLVLMKIKCELSVSAFLVNVEGIKITILYLHQVNIFFCSSSKGGCIIL